MHLPKNCICFFFLTAFFFFSCTNNRKVLSHNNPDTSVLVKQYNVYDSFYKLYTVSNDIRFLRQGGLFADSVLNIPLTEIDSSFHKTYIFLLYSRGADLNDLHNFIKSREFFDRYISLYPQYNISGPENLAYAQMTLANIYSRYGDYNKALLLLEQGKKYYTAIKDTESITASILNMSIALKELQRYDEVEQTLQKIFQFKYLSSKRKGLACIELADIYLRHNKIAGAGLQIQKAKEYLAITPYKAYDPDRADTYASLYSIEGDWYMAKNDPQGALKAYRRSLDSARISSAQDLRNRVIGKTYIAMGKALERVHLSDSALYYYNRALYTVTNIDTTDKFFLPQQKDIYAENTIAEALYARADCIITRGMENVPELENAASCYKLAFETERKLLDAFTYDESRLQMAGETRKQAEKAIAVCYRLYQKTKNLNWANEAFLFAEHNKSFVLAESIRRNTAASIYLQKDAVYEKVQSLRGNLASIEIELNKQKFSALPDTGLILTLTATKQKTEEEFLVAENDLRIKNPEYNNRITQELSLSAGEIINRTVSSGGAVIEYFTGDSAVYAFSGEKNKPVSFYKLPGTVKNNTNDFLYFFSNQNLILNDPVKYATVANTLYRSILGPYQQSGNRSLLIIPDGFISYIPFDALVTAATGSTDISSFPFLIKQQETYYAFSCKTLLAQAQSENNAVDNSLAAFAPAFANKERNLSPLLHSNDEIASIKQFYPQGKFYTGNAATLKQFEEDCDNAGIIHLATHANSGSDSAAAGIEFYDSTLYLKRIYALPLKARLVVLSGCQTGTGAVNKTEGLMSLARGFSYAGTKNVIASLWQTEDNSSAEIFKNFYSNLSGNDFSTALYKAKLSAIKNSTVASASPYYWSGYIYIGSPAENISRQSTGKLKMIAVLTALTLIIIYFSFKRKKP